MYNTTKENPSQRLVFMLQILKKYNVRDTTLETVYHLSRKTLYRIRQGQALRTSHSHYFRTLLRAIYDLYQKAIMETNERQHRELHNVMFQVMLEEFEIAEKKFCVK